MAKVTLVNAYQTFLKTAGPFISIKNEEGYQQALDTLEAVLELASDSLDDSLNPLIDLLSHAIEVYESKDLELQAFIAEADSIPSDIALLRTLMSQHGLKGSDLPEIGDKTMVSKVLNGKRVLQRSAIERLAQRFGIRPALFLGG